MTHVVLITTMLLTGIFGYRIMDCMDRFLHEHVRGEEGADEPESSGAE